MSRSYKKNPGYKDQDTNSKRLHNRRFRRLSPYEEFPSGKAYRKYSCSWDICDWRCVYPAPYLVKKERREWLVYPPLEPTPLYKMYMK